MGFSHLPLPLLQRLSWTPATLVAQGSSSLSGLGGRKKKKTSDLRRRPRVPTDNSPSRTPSRTIPPHVPYFSAMKAHHRCMCMPGAITVRKRIACRSTDVDQGHRSQQLSYCIRAVPHRQVLPSKRETHLLRKMGWDTCQNFFDDDSIRLFTILVPR